MRLAIIGDGRQRPALARRPTSVRRCLPLARLVPSAAQPRTCPSRILFSPLKKGGAPVLPVLRVDGFVGTLPVLVKGVTDDVAVEHGQGGFYGSKVLVVARVARCRLNVVC